VNLKRALSKNTVATNLPGSTKQEIIESLLDILIGTGKVHSREKALEALLQREEKMSTGMKYGIGIPHGKTDTVEELVACVAVSSKEVDFESLDGEPCRIFIMTLSPENRNGPHLQFLAEVSSILKEKEKRDKILAAKNSDEILSILTK
jgi:fructose-specific phosphotransferase system IIA component